MDKIEKITRTIEDRIHHFYCDECHEYLGNSKEYDDGYYHKIGNFELRFYLRNKWHKVEKYLCDDCREKFLQNVENTLVGLGFSLER